MQLIGCPVNDIKNIFSLMVPITAIINGFAFCLVCDQSYSFRWFLLAFSLLTLISCIIVGRQYVCGIDIPKAKSLGLFAGFILWAVASLTWTPVLGDSFLTLLVFLVVLPATLLAFKFNASQERLFKILLIILLILTAGETIIQALYQSIPRPKGYFSDRNTNGGYMAMLLLPFCAQLLIKEEQKRSSVLLGLLISFCTLAIGFTLSRGAILGFGVGLSLLLLASWHLKVRFTGGLKLLAYISAGFLISDYFNQSFNQFTLAARMADVSSIESIGTGRDMLWRAGWQMYLDKPLFGWGLDMFHWLFPQYRYASAPDLGQFAHNDYLQILIELGPIGLVLFLSFIIFLCIENWSLYENAGLFAEKMDGLGLFSGMVVVLVQSLVNFNLYQASITVMLGFYAGILINKQCQLNLISKTQIPVAKYLSKFGFQGLLTLMTLLVAVWSGLFYLSLRAAYEPIPNETPLTGIDKLEKAQQILPYREEYLASFANHVATMLLHDFDKFTAADIEILTSESLSRLEVAIQKNPYRAINFSNKARLLINKATTPEAYRDGAIKTSYEKALRIDPNNLQIRMDYVNYLGGLGEMKEALMIMEKGLNRTYFENYQFAVDYMKLLLPLYIQSAEPDKVIGVEAQLDRLLEKNKNNHGSLGGIFTLEYPVEK